MDYLVAMEFLNDSKLRIRYKECMEDQHCTGTRLNFRN